MQTITKKELIERISVSTGQRRGAVKDTVQEFLNIIIEELGKGNRLEFRDFGVFESKLRAARKAQNPKTLERVIVPAKPTVKFKPGRKMKTAIEDGYNHRQNMNETDMTPAPEIVTRPVRVPESTSPHENH